MVSLCFMLELLIICDNMEPSLHGFLYHWCMTKLFPAITRRHNERDGVSNHQPYDCLLNRLFKSISKKTSKLRVTDLCEGNSPETKGQ